MESVEAKSRVWSRYVVAVGLVLLAWTLRLGLSAVIGPTQLPLTFFFPAIALAAWYSGLAPALVSLLLALLLSKLSFIDPADGIAPVVAFIVACAPIIAAVEALRRTRARMAKEIRLREEVEREQEQAQQSLLTTFASIGDGVAVTNSQGQVTFLNPEGERLTGWTAWEAIGQPLSSVFHVVNEQTRDIVENPAEKVLRLGAGAGLEDHTILIAKNGREIPIDDSAAPIVHRGVVSGVVLVFRDVTEQRAANHARGRLAAIVEFSGDAIITKDLRGIIQTWNAGAERLFGYTAQEIIGKHITTIIPPERLDEETEILSRLRGGLSYHRVETVRVRKDSRRIPVSISASPIKDAEGKVTGASKIFHDIGEIVAARDALARETELMAITLRSIGDAVVITDAAGSVTFLNAEAERLMGWTQTEAAGRALPEVFRIINEETRHTVENPVDRVLRTGKVTGLANHTLLLSRDGTERPIDDSAAPIAAPGGSLLGVVLVFRDFSAKRQAERALRESEGRFRLMADAAPVLIWISGVDKRCTWFNQGWLDFVGRSMEKEIGNGWRENVHLIDYGACLETYVTSFDARRPFTMTYRLRRADGEYRWVFDTGVPRFEPDGAFAGYIGSCIDITERKRAEDDLHENARRKDEFLAVLSHELRNPLAAIRMAIYLLQQSGVEAKDQRRFRSIIDRQTWQMTRLLDDLMDVSRISSGKISLKKELIDLNKIVANAAESMQPEMHARGHVFTVNVPETPVYVNGDPVRLAQILANILNNAARYTDHGGAIRLTLERDERSAVICVIDSGIGLSREQMPHIFGMFTRIDRSLERGQGGLGVGLSLSKQLAELHGGSIEARSEGLGKGSEFTVRVPLASEASNGLGPSAKGASARLKKKILIADDNADSAMALGILLELSGHDVRTVYDGQAAVEMALTFAPDVAILDIGMPKLNGYDVARQIRARDLPIFLIALTGWGQEQDRQRAREAGFNHHLTKPIDVPVLEKVLATSILGPLAA